MPDKFSCEMTLGDLLADPASEKVLKAQEGFGNFLIILRLRWRWE